ncbi:hypothetical protein [Thioclava sp. GXIMD2076]|uniref:hypothetical protein n=1 Tax=Thioclava sp. GXIMD2076 TaxID=3131931 RepID=UPI0030CDB9FA
MVTAFALVLLLVLIFVPQRYRLCAMLPIMAAFITTAPPVIAGLTGTDMPWLLARVVEYNGWIFGVTFGLSIFLAVLMWQSVKEEA